MLRTLSHLVDRLTRRANPQEREPPAAPPGHRLYAVGDIHGEIQLLQRLLVQIGEDAQPAIASGMAVSLVFLGDYVDRGGDSRAVVERLRALSLPGIETRFLMGNHEQALLDFLDDPEQAGDWLNFGGLETLASYGVLASAGSGDRLRWQSWRDSLRERMPAEHLDFLSALEVHCVYGDYLFVHAGIRPGRPLASQTLKDLLWIREPFLSSRRPHEKHVVHGHSVSQGVDEHPYRTGIDTGAYATGCLTALVLEGIGRRFLQT